MLAFAPLYCAANFLPKLWRITIFRRYFSLRLAWAALPLNIPFYVLAQVLMLLKLADIKVAPILGAFLFSFLSTSGGYCSRLQLDDSLAFSVAL